MRITERQGPQRCVLCLRTKEEAIEEHLKTQKECCPQCPLKQEIKQALDKPSVGKQIMFATGYILIGLIVYYITYIVWDWKQITAILTAIFWYPILIGYGLYWIGKWFIGLF